MNQSNPSQLTPDLLEVIEGEEIKKWLHPFKPVASIVRLPGDASSRKYFRVSSAASGDVPGDSYIVMRMEPFSQGTASNLPFLAMQGFLWQSQVPVPQVHWMQPERGLIVLEDLGDQTLLHRLAATGSEAEETALYQQVIDLLVQFQLKTKGAYEAARSAALASPSTTSPSSLGAREELPSLECFQLRFDYEKLMWEVNFTIENFLKKYLKRTLSLEDLTVLQEGFSQICRLLADQPVVLTHRDYHSRNVMLHENRWLMIDFQDARLGPMQYDLASLLSDSYYQLSETQEHFLTNYYYQQIAQQGGELQIALLARAEFDRLLDLMAVQRNFKAIGSFSFFLNQRGDARYLKYIGNTFESMRLRLGRYPQFARLREVLFRYYHF